VLQRRRRLQEDHELGESLRRRGENISAWEVERVLNEHPAVAESAVIGAVVDRLSQEASPPPN